jgi:hypothetical protein
MEHHNLVTELVLRGGQPLALTTNTNGEDVVVASATKLVTSFCPVDVLLSQ